MTLQRCAKFALLDLAKTGNGFDHELNHPKAMHARYKLMKKIDSAPEKVELSKEEQDLFTSLLPYHYEVRIVGQIIDIL